MSSPVMEVGAAVVRPLIRRATQGLPFETCGFIMNHSEILEIRNVADNPMRAFVMDRTQLEEKASPRYSEITAIWHSHPTGSCEPSPGDLKTLDIPGCIDPLWEYWIVTTLGVFTWPR